MHNQGVRECRTPDGLFLLQVTGRGHVGDPIGRIGRRAVEADRLENELCRIHIKLKKNGESLFGNGVAGLDACFGELVIPEGGDIFAVNSLLCLVKNIKCIPLDGRPHAIGTSVPADRYQCPVTGNIDWGIAVDLYEGAEIVGRFLRGIIAAPGL